MLDIKKVLKGIQFRPGWRFRLDQSGDIVVTARVANAYRRGPSRVTVYGYVTNPAQYQTEQHLLEQVYEAISSILHHEASEWFRYQGKRWFDPHE